jgi:hypothetical protein
MAESRENDAPTRLSSKAFKGSTPPRPSKRSGLGIDFPGMCMINSLHFCCLHTRGSSRETQLVLHCIVFTRLTTCRRCPVRDAHNIRRKFDSQPGARLQESCTSKLWANTRLPRIKFLCCRSRIFRATNRTIEDGFRQYRKLLAVRNRATLIVVLPLTAVF